MPKHKLKPSNNEACDKDIKKKRKKDKLASTVPLEVEQNEAAPAATSLSSSSSHVREVENGLSSPSTATLPPVVSLPRSIPPHLPFQGYKRKSTITVALPSSIISNAQRGELKSYLVGEIARSLTIFGVDAVIIYEDYPKSPLSSHDATSSLDAFSQELEFFVRNLQYLETPQYLRKWLFPMHPDFKFSGLQNPVDAPHHVRKDEWLPYREGVVVNTPSKSKLEINEGSWIYCGLFDNVWIPQAIKEGVRVTVKLENAVKKYFKINKKRVEAQANNLPLPRKKFNPSNRLEGTVVSPSDPPSLLGLYWGYTVSAKMSLFEVVKSCSFTEDGRFDLCVGTSQNGINVNKDFVLPKYNNMLLIFGAIDGLEEVLANAQGETENPEDIFDMYLNVCPLQRSRTIRTEEAIPITLSVLRPHIHANDL